MVQSRTKFDDWWDSFGKEAWPNMRFLAEQAYIQALHDSECPIDIDKLLRWLVKRQEKLLEGKRRTPLLHRKIARGIKAFTYREIRNYVETAVKKSLKRKIDANCS